MSANLTEMRPTSNRLFEAERVLDRSTDPKLREDSAALLRDGFEKIKSLAEKPDAPKELVQLRDKTAEELAGIYDSGKEVSVFFRCYQELLKKAHQLGGFFVGGSFGEAVRITEDVSQKLEKKTWRAKLLMFCKEGRPEDLV